MFTSNNQSFWLPQWTYYQDSNQTDLNVTKDVIITTPIVFPTQQVAKISMFGIADYDSANHYGEYEFTPYGIQSGYNMRYNYIKKSFSAYGFSFGIETFMIGY